MRKMKISVERPWLTSTGVELPTEKLREISKTWSPIVWEEYLTWYESGRREQLVKPWIYETAGDQQTDSVFVQFGYENSPARSEMVAQLLGKAGQDEALILTRIFLDGCTIREVAADLGLPKSTVLDIKSRALSRLKQGYSGDRSDTPRFMRGENISPQQSESTIWDEPLDFPIKQNRSYELDNHHFEFEQIKTSSLRVALGELSELSGLVLYLRHWCEHSLMETARRLGWAANVIAQIEASAISKVKCSAIANETGNIFGGAKCY